jgi:hypothetical protein
MLTVAYAKGQFKFRVWVVPQAQPHSGKPLRGLWCSLCPGRSRLHGSQSLHRLAVLKATSKSEDCFGYATAERV